ncbi:uncharacterized protein LOC113866766 [Abrus precatorius]|uniref:Uncharacterized protein LOC113866766 n=1 Tax=Abrus precatorius TaxID=3816 RepID=A0A8B8LN78_ABRPR|nr:uncharacterized protein LOC113866766 [Abrus precatorius]
MTSPQNVKEVQRLAGRIAALARFLPIMADRSWPFIDLLKKSKKFVWTDEYIVISLVLLQETPELTPVYFISRTLQGPESRYQLMEKVVLALVHTTRWLRHYLQSHRVVVCTDCPMAKVLRKPELAGPNVVTIEQFIRFGFNASNNQAEYEALLAGLRLAKDIGVKRITCWSDSKIVADQVNGIYKVKDSIILQYYQEFNNIKDEFDEVHVQHTPMTMNEQADRLARLASQRKPGQLQSVIHQEIPQPSIAKQECMDIENMPQNWMTPIIQYLTSNSLSKDPASAKKIRMHAAKYLILGNELYRRRISTPMLKCLNEDKASYVMREIHEGICGTHSGGRTMAAKILRAGYFWLILAQDYQTFVKKCILINNTVLIYINTPTPFTLLGLPDPLLFGKWTFSVLFPWQKGNFTHRRFNEFLEGLHIKHSQTNGQAEAANKVILHELKQKLGSAKGEWAEKLHEILWAYRFEIGEPSFRGQNFEELANDESLAVNLDLLDEVGQAAIVTKASKKMMARKLNSKVNPRQFYVNDLV